MEHNPSITVGDRPGQRIAGGEIFSIERPRSQSTNPNSATQHEDERDAPHPERADGTDGTASRKTVHRAARMLIASMMGVSISSAILVPTRGTIHRVRTAQA